MQSIKNTDIIRRTFIKMRGSYAQEQNFTTHAGIFHYDGENQLLQRLLNHLVQTFFAGYTERELGCSNSEKLDGFIVEEVEYEEITKLAFFSEYAGNGNKQHIICQDYFLKNDPFTLCYELPVYNEERSGFIDLVRFVDGRIQILDFKPHAKKDNKIQVGSQLTRYRDLLCYNTGIDKSMIDLYYFDEEVVYKIIDSK